MVPGAARAVQRLPRRAGAPRFVLARRQGQSDGGGPRGVEHHGVPHSWGAARVARQGARARAAGVAAAAVARASQNLGGLAVCQLRPSSAWAVAGAKYALKEPDGAHARASWADAVAAAWEGDFADSADGHLALDLLLGARSKNSNKNFDSKLRLFFEFCGSRVPPLDPLLATGVHIIEYIAWHGRRGKVKMSRPNFQPYLSAINTFLAELKRPRVAMDNKGISNALNALAQRQRLAPGGVMAARRVYLPAPVAADVVARAEAVTHWRTAGALADELERLRPLLATAVCFQFMDRPHTSTGARWGDFSVALDVAHENITFLERDVKVNLAGVLATRNIEVPVGAAADNMQRRLAILLARFMELKQLLCPEFCIEADSRFWAISGDTRTEAWASPVQNAWLQLSLRAVDARPPENFVWQAQSLRKGAASSASAVGAPLPKIKYIGGWATGSSVPEQRYIDPTCPRSAAAYDFFGFLI